MTTTINIKGTLILDQNSGLAGNVTATGGNSRADSSAFQTLLNGLTGDLQLSAGQLAYADDVKASVSDAGLVTVTADGSTISKQFADALRRDS